MVKQAFPCISKKEEQKQERIVSPPPSNLILSLLVNIHLMLFQLPLQRIHLNLPHFHQNSSSQHLVSGVPTHLFANKQQCFVPLQEESIPTADRDGTIDPSEGVQHERQRMVVLEDSLEVSSLPQSPHEVSKKYNAENG